MSVMLQRRLSEASAATRSPRTAGQVLPLFAIFLVVLIGFTALTVDYGTYLIARRNYQNVADSAALAGSAYLARPLTATKRADARSAAWAYLSSQLGLSGPFPTTDTDESGYVEKGWTMWVDTPPTAAGAKYAGDTALTGSASVYVRVERDNPAFLGRVLGITGRRIDAWATAGGLPTRWAVIALCPRNDPTCPNMTKSVSLSGSNTQLRVVDGDLGSNWGLRINSNAADRLQLPGDAQAYLVDTTCDPSHYLCYPDPNVSDGSGTAKLVREMPAPVEDPMYVAPSYVNSPTPEVPWRGDAGHDVSIPNGSGTILNATGPNVTCGPGSPKIGPGRYRDLDIKANSCVILDPTFGLTTSQQPGIIVITGKFSIGNNSFVIGDGVTIFFDSGATPFNPTGGIVINNGNAGMPSIPNGAAKYGAWTTKGRSPWSPADSGTPPATTWTTPSTNETGLAFYVLSSTGSTKTAIFNMSGTSPLIFQGILYGPNDNVNVSGSGTQAAVGQIIGWTVGYNGNTLITQVFDGPADSKSYLLEPRTGQGD